MQLKTLEQHADEMRRLCRQLIPYSFPKSEEGSDLLPLKNRQIVVDGYDVSVNMDFFDFDKYIVESLQVQGVYTPFLPFYVVCKIAHVFLGSSHLAYADFVRSNRKVYCWTVRRRGNKTLKPTSKSTPGHYEDFSYSVLEPGQLNLYGTKD